MARLFSRLILLLFLLSSPLSAQVESNKLLRDSLLAHLEDETADSIVMHYLELEGIKTTKRNHITFFKNGREKFADLFPRLLEAKHHIHLEYFNFRNDSINKELIDILEKKVQDGVQVRILFDAFGNISNDSPLKRRHLDSIRAKGIEIHKFDPIRFPWVNHVATRDHRKLAIIDGSIAYTGGMNIADYYITGIGKIGSWRDLHCRIEGEAVADIQRIFMGMWQKTTGEILPVDSVYYPIIPSMTDSLNIAVVDRSPKLQPDALKDAYALSIAGAKQNINIVNPYFVPTAAISRSIRKALNSGIEVHIMVSEKSDIPFTPEAMLHKLRKLQKRGAKIHLFQGGFHHAKMMTVDGRFSTMGSANLNSRSLRYDYETNLFIFDEGVTQQLDSLYQDDKAQCIPLDNAYWKKRSLWKKFVGWFANIFTPFL